MTESAIDCLIVEDSPSQALQLQGLLEQHGYRVQVALDGEKALAMLDEFEPTIIISDIMMPLMDGYDLCRAIKTHPRHRSIMVMLLTSLSDAEDIFRALECGADNFMNKPAEPKQLIARVEYLIANRKLRDEEAMSAGLEVNFGGQRQFITSSRLQILNLLLSTYDLAVQKNKELREASEALQSLNSELERKVEERTHALRERESFLQAILDCGSAPIFVKDFEGQYISCNRAFEQIVGLPREELRGKSDFDIFPRDSARRLRENDLRVINSKQTIEVEEELVQDGSSHTFHAIKFLLDDGEGNQYAVCTHATDITERKRAEQERRLLYVAAEQSGVGMTIVDAAGNMALLNAAMEQICGSPRAELQSVEDIDLGGEEVTGASFAEVWRQLAQQGGPLQPAVFVRDDARGERVWRVRFSRVAGDDGVTSHYLVVAEDLTEQRRLETQVRRRQRIESLGTLAGGIAHDFNNILTAIIGYTDLALLHLEDAAQVRGELAHVLNAGSRAQHLVQQILRFSKPADSSYAPTNLHVLIGEVLNLIQAGLPKSIQVRTAFDDRCGTVMADATQLHQVLMNLCTNAHQAMGHKPGLLEIATECFHIDEGEHDIHPDLAAGDYTRISVSDTGQGMDKQTMERIFDPFFTTKQQKGGTGLGLSVCHRVVRDHKGTITVYSEPGKGTTFHVYLPLALDAETSTPPVAMDAQPGGNERIAVVDDEAIIAELTQKKLELLGYKVTAFNSPLDCLQKLRESPQDFDLLITDATMPHMLGEQLAAEAARLNPALPILMVSGYREIQRESDQPVNVKGMLVKPVSTPELASTVRSILDAQKKESAAT